MQATEAHYPALAEEAVLGCILHEPEGLAAAREIISKRDFINPINGAIFGAMVDLDTQGRPIDVVTVTAALDGAIPDHAQDRILSHLAKCTIYVADATRIATYAAIVRDAAKRNGAPIAVTEPKTPSVTPLNAYGENDCNGVTANSDIYIKNTLNRLAAEDEAEFDRLAALTPAGFDREKKAAAKRLNISIATLKLEVGNRRRAADEGKGRAEPKWSQGAEMHPEPVEGADLMAGLISAIRVFVAIDENDAFIIALWVLFTWQFESGAETNPFLRIISATPGCGKSTLFKVLQRLARSGWMISRMSQSAFTRAMSEQKRTLLLDEGDAYLNSNEAMRNLLDGASDPDTAHVTLSVKSGDDWKPVELDVFVPIAIASIGPLRRMETVEDRSIAVYLKRAMPAELAPLKKGRRRELKDSLEPLLAKCARWAADNPPDPDRRPSIPEMSGREMDKWEPLLGIADLIGGEWSSRAREVAMTKSKSRGDDGQTVGVILLNDIRAIFASKKDPKGLSSNDLCAALVKIEEHEWAEFGAGRRPITQRQLAETLKPFSIFPHTIRIPASSPVKGYEFSDFREAWLRYPSLLTHMEKTAVTPLQPNGDKGLRGVTAGSFGSVTENPAVTTGEPEFERATETNDTEVIL